MAKISIIVPYLKGPAYLEDCIQSIEDQKMDDIEVVLVDDKDGHDVPEAILQKSFVKYVRMEDEKDVDEFYEKKGIFLEERRRKRLGMNKEEYAANGYDDVEFMISTNLTDASVWLDFSLYNDDSILFYRNLQFMNLFQQFLICYLKYQLDQRILCAVTNHILIRSGAQRKINRADNNRFTSSSLTTQYIQSLCKIDFCLLNQSQILHM